LADGTLLVTGGHYISFEGLNVTKIYNPATNSAGSWTTPVSQMNDRRWYPTTTTLPGGHSGDALVIAGQIISGKYNNTPQVWQAAKWRSLGQDILSLSYYPYMFVAPNGKVFLAGPVGKTRYLDTSDSFTGTNRWQLVGTLTTYPRNWGSAVMYEPGKVLVMGGINCPWYPDNTSTDPSKHCNNPPTATAEMIDLNPSPAPSPTWQPAGSMAYARKLHNAPLLPNGNVFVSGGSSGMESPDGTPTQQNQVLTCEMWNPKTQAWSRKANLPRYRGYHSIALLLPDGRVLSAGGDAGNLVPNASAEVYSPEYLFNGARPTISSAPTSISYYSSTNQTFTINTSNLTGTPRVTMLAPGSVTHGFNMGQRFIELHFTANGNNTTLTVTPPANANLAPPGYYMLFILNSSGVPSFARFVQLHL
jgi:galactose oxidase